MGLVTNLKRLFARLPRGVRFEIKRLKCAREIRAGRFLAGEPEADRLADWLKPGDWVVDAGANIGEYSLALSTQVGEAGRVISIEPIPDTFALLAANSRVFPLGNVSLLNIALSDQVALATMRLPLLESGLPNYYQASLEYADPSAEGYAVLTVPFDNLGIARRVALIKIDVEGHDEPVLRGMMGTIARDLPTLIIEAPTPWTDEQLGKLGYLRRKFAGSPNTVFVVEATA